MPVAPNFRLQWLDTTDSDLYPYRSFMTSDLSSDSDLDSQSEQQSFFWIYSIWVMGVMGLAMLIIFIVYRRKSSSYDDSDSKNIPHWFLNDESEVKLDFNTKPVQPTFSLRERIAQSVPWKSSVSFHYHKWYYLQYYSSLSNMITVLTILDYFS